MKLTFLGTRGNIEPKTDLHHRHTSMLVSYYGQDVMIDAGEDWRGLLDEIGPDAIVVTHAHPDHAFGLKGGAPCTVWAPEAAWEEMDRYPIGDERTLALREPTEICGITFEAFPVEHSSRAPAVGYRITAGRVTIFYVPDVVYIEDREEALGGAKVYVGDGATLDRNMVRRIDGHLIGHTPVRTQLTWCQQEGVPKMYVTHCGSQIVAGDERKIGAKLREMAEERGVEAEIATDGMEVVLR